MYCLNCNSIISNRKNIVQINVKQIINIKIILTYNNTCCKCGWNKVNPYTQNIPLEIEHIDGNYKNNNEDNLILLCPNCHSLTSTYKGANLNHGRKSRKKYYIDKEEL